MKTKTLRTKEGAVVRTNGPMSDEIRADVQTAFLDAFALQGTVTEAARTAQIDRTTIYHWLKHDVQFGNAYADAITSYNDVVRNALHERGVIGVRKALFQKGQPVLDVFGNQVYETVHSDALLALIARARLPEYKNTDALQAVTGVAITENSLIIEDIRDLQEHVLDLLLQDLERIETEKKTYAHTTIVTSTASESATAVP